MTQSGHQRGMILRMTDSQDIPWKRLFVEAAAIVASILLAFAIDAWWIDRQIRYEEQEILQGMEEEFVSVHAALARDMAAHLKNIQSLENLLLAFENGLPENSGAVVDAVLLELLDPTTTDLGNGTLNALLSSGRAEILRSRKLRTLLAAWEGVIGEVWDDQANNARMVFDIHIPYFVSENVAVGPLMHQWYSAWPVSLRSPSDDPEAFERLIQDPRFRVMVEIRYGYKRHLTGEFDAAITAAEAILAEIEKSID